MRTLTTVWAILGIAAAAAALVYVFFLSGGRTDAPPLPSAITREGASEKVAPRVGDDVPRGGVFSGVVVDEAGKGIADAGVILVTRDTGPNLDDRPQERDPSQGFDLSDVAIFEPRPVAEVKTDATGRFRVAADARSAVRFVVGHAQGYMPAIVGVPGPTEEIRIVLTAAGAVVGTVLDAENGKPVTGADVAVYLQTKATPAPLPGGSGVPSPSSPREPLAELQDFVAKHLGEAVWGVRWQGDSALHVRTDSSGTFRFGPIGPAVQLEFVITHPDYAWMEHDLQDGRVTRTVVQAGQTVTRTFRLAKGKFIAGKVVDEQTKGVPDVIVEVEHVVQMYQPWFYRDHKRVTRTSGDGTFRVGGLSHGPYVVNLKHESFGTEHITGVPENTDGLVYSVRSVGALEGTVEGLSGARAGVRVETVLERTGAEGASDHETKQFRIDPSGRFTWDDLKPGRYVAWVRVGSSSSLPQEVEIKSHDVASVRFELGGGGTVALSVVDGSGRPLDPVTVNLVEVKGGAERPLGQFFTRGGALEAEGIRPGTYRVEASAPGYQPAKGTTFSVSEGRTTRLEPITLRKTGFVKIAGVRRADRRALSGPVLLSLKVGDGPFLPQFLRGPATMGIPVVPGKVTVKAEGPDGLAFEEEVVVGDGETKEVEVLLR